MKRPLKCFRLVQLCKSKHRQVTDLDVTDLGFSGPGFRSARQGLCGDASRLSLYHFSKHLSSVLGRTELCHEVRNPGPQKPQIIRNENHHLALFDKFQRLWFQDRFLDKRFRRFGTVPVSGSGSVPGPSCKNSMEPFWKVAFCRRRAEYGFRRARFQ